MAFEQNGIGSIVEKKVNAYRNNPQALEKRYQQNEQLIDLLALQKLKNEKVATANQIALSLENNPNTRKEQLEQEVLALTKNEMAQQATGILGQQQKQQQKNIQRVAKGQGIPAAQPPQRAAQGGIMGYAHGGEHDSEDVDEGGMINFMTENAAELVAAGIFGADQLNEARKKGGLGNLAISAIDKLKKLPGRAGKIGDIAAKAAQLFTRKGPKVRGPDTKISTPKGESSIMGPMIAGPRVFSPSRVAAGVGVGLAGKAAVDALTDDEGTLTAPIITKSAAPVKDKKPSPVDPLEERRLEIQRQKQELIKQGETFDPTEGITGTAISDRNEASGINAILKNQINQDPMALANQERDDFYKDSNRTGIASTLQRRIDDIEAYDAKRYDPAKVEKEAAKRAYEAMGVAGAGSAGINAARNSYMDSAENAQRNSLVQYFNLEQAKIGRDLEIVNKGNELKAKIWGTLATERSNAMSIVSSVNVADVQNATAQASEARQANDAKIDRQLTSLRDDSADRRAEIMASIENRKIDVNLYRDLMALEAKVKAALRTDERFLKGETVMDKRAADPDAKLTLEEQNDAMYFLVQLAESTAIAMLTEAKDALSGEILREAEENQDKVTDDDGDIATAVAAMQAAAGS